MLVPTSHIAGSLQTHSLESLPIWASLSFAVAGNGLLYFWDRKEQEQEHPSASLPSTTTDLVASVDGGFMFQGRVRRRATR